MIRKNTSTLSRWKKAAVHLFPVPALAVYIAFIVVPIVTAFGYSLYDWKGMNKGEFIGLGNFKTLFTMEPFNTMFWRAFGHNLYLFAFKMIILNGLSFILAYIIYTKIRGAGFFKIAFFLPRLLSVIVVGFLWKMMLNPNNGIVNVFLKKVGLSDWTMPWLGDTRTALSSIATANVWFDLGFFVLLFLAGLQSMSSEVIEAAKMDGAIGIRLFRSIILPLIKPSLMIIVVLTFIHSFEAFELVYAMEGSSGAPVYSTDLLAVYFYRIAFGGSSADVVAVGLGSALAVVLFFIIALLSSLSLFVFRKEEA
ncbi:carbohydrate ABC transporter permease [Cohnella faecalis]|uniref:Sugar ABC transporter permease n=1 Tax=Cohnella faecalis TaxID=2315694 RepID=A0A398CP20_9BACL|nr:sugar ABC transporter permease [Cohnella faecalis]RIE01281.1 sugar ABC transporter permease [Cohnella faecalis]